MISEYNFHELTKDCKHKLKPVVANMIIYYANNKPVYADPKTDKVCGYCGKMFYKKVRK